MIESLTPTKEKGSASASFVPMPKYAVSAPVEIQLACTPGGSTLVPGTGADGGTRQLTVGVTAYEVITGGDAVGVGFELPPVDPPVVPPPVPLLPLEGEVGVGVGMADAVGVALGVGVTESLGEAVTGGEAVAVAVDV